MLATHFNELTEIQILHEGSSLPFSLHHAVSDPHVLPRMYLDEFQEHFPVLDHLPARIVRIISLFIKGLVST